MLWSGQLYLNLSLAQDVEGTPLVVQWIRLSAPNAGDLNVIRGWGTGIQSHHFIKIDGGNMEKVSNFIFSALKSPWAVTVVMKLKDSTSLKEKL